LIYYVYIADDIRPPPGRGQPARPACGQSRGASRRFKMEPSVVSVGVDEEKEEIADLFVAKYAFQKPSRWWMRKAISEGHHFSKPPGSGSAGSWENNVLMDEGDKQPCQKTFREKLHDPCPQTPSRGFWRTAFLIFFRADRARNHYHQTLITTPAELPTYSLAGSESASLFLWTFLPITVALIIIQEMCARMGVVSGKGLSDLIGSALAQR